MDKKFEENYLGIAEQNRIRAILKEIVQGKEERANNFIPKVRQYLLLLYPSMVESEQVTAIAEKMRGEYAMAIIDKEPNSVEDLRSICRKVEAANDLKRSSSVNTNNRSIPSRPKQYGPKESQTSKSKNSNVPTCSR